MYDKNVAINVEIGSGSMNRANLVCDHLIITLVAMSEESFAAAIVSRHSRVLLNCMIVGQCGDGLAVLCKC